LKGAQRVISDVPKENATRKNLIGTRRVKKLSYVLAFSLCFLTIINHVLAIDLSKNDKKIFESTLKSLNISITNCPPLEISRRQICGQYKKNDEEIALLISISISKISKMQKRQIFPLGELIFWIARSGSKLTPIGCNKPNKKCQLPSDYDFLISIFRLDQQYYAIRIKNGYLIAYETKI
jgi:hypothetical protein